MAAVAEAEYANHRSRVKRRKLLALASLVLVELDGSSSSDCEGMSQDDSEDDYMSENVLSACHDHRPGLAFNHATKRKLEAEKKRMEANKRNNMKSRKVLEQESRTEALSKPIGEDNKGFSLLKKMGFKPGMSLGKTGTSIREPIPIVVKEGRGGLGQEAEARERIEARLKTVSEAECSRMAEKFREAKRNVIVERKVIGDLRKSQRACCQLDQEKDVTVPEQPWFWPPENAKADKSSEEEDDDDPPPKDQHQESQCGSDEEDKDEEATEMEPLEQLQLVTSYLRDIHHYCIWCAIRFDGLEDMKDNCPGPTREDHEE
ncbi:G patch domain-containing protein 11-like [Ornithodoros turicata]|uniref:G patch domain-containing protein 11-like n=1 Tax=Ornithodoros turicata TaxID=34597 RepID=UPI003139C00A